MRNLFDKLKNNNNNENNNGLVQVNPVQNNMAQPQNSTLYGHLTSDNTVGGTDTTNNSRMNSLQGAISNGANAFSGFKGGGGTPWGAIAGAGKNTYNFITNKTPSEYSDTEQSIIYPLQGAAMGSRFGPLGAAAGALYGLGYSFKDDIGLKDSNFFTKLLFPIGMGDGGGFIDMG